MLSHLDDRGDYTLAYRVFGVLMMVKSSVSALVTLAGGFTLHPDVPQLKATAVAIWAASAAVGVHFLVRRRTHSLVPLCIGITFDCLVACLPLAVTHNTGIPWVLFIIWPPFVASALLPLRTAWLATGTTLAAYGAIVIIWGSGGRLGEWLTVAVWLAATTAVCSTLYTGSRILAGRLHEQALRDSLTGLANRRAFDEFLDSLIAQTERRPQRIALLMFDIDHFKQVNDSSGHAAGDAVLSRFSRLLARSVRPGDLAARTGGEEFTVIMPGATLDEGARRANEIRCSVEATSQRSWGRRVTVSVGMALRAEDGRECAVDLTAAADRVLYEAKASGRNVVRVASVVTP